MINISSSPSDEPEESSLSTYFPFSLFGSLEQSIVPKHLGFFQFIQDNFKKILLELVSCWELNQEYYKYFR
jgi:hypothetical protein